MKLLLVVLFCAVQCYAVDWISLLPQPGVARDFSMGCATGAMFGSSSATSQNPAGFTVFPPNKRTGLGAVLNGNGPSQLGTYFDQTANLRSGVQQVADVSSLMVRSISARHRWAAVSAIFAETGDETGRFEPFPMNLLTNTR